MMMALENKSAELQKMSENECPSYLDWKQDRDRNPYRKPKDIDEVEED